MDEAQTSEALAAAENYEKNVVRYTTGPFTVILLDQVRVQPGERVLDVACGTGIVARQAASLVGLMGSVVGLDINPAMLEVARSLPAPAGARIEWREGSALELPLPDASFDLVLCQASLQFFLDRQVALREMQRVLRLGGRLAISVARSIEHNPASNLIWGAIARHLNTEVNVLTRGFSLGEATELHALLEAAGFTEINITIRNYTVREPRNPQLIATILASLAGIVPAFAAMSGEERAALAQAVEDEIKPKLQAYVVGDEQLYPTSVHIALARKPK